MVPAENKAKRLSSVNHTTKTIHHHHHQTKEVQSVLLIKPTASSCLLMDIKPTVK